MNDGHDDRGGADPYEQACNRLTAAGLWPPIAGFGVDGKYGEDGEAIGESAHIEHYGGLSVEVAAQIRNAMGPLSYTLERVTFVNDKIVGADGRDLGGPSRRDDPDRPLNVPSTK